MNIEESVAVKSVTKSCVTKYFRKYGFNFEEPTDDDVMKNSEVAPGIIRLPTHLFQCYSRMQATDYISMNDDLSTEVKKGRQDITHFSASEVTENSID